MKSAFIMLVTAANLFAAEPVAYKRAAPPRAGTALISPADSAQWAARDILGIAPADRPYIRYLTIYNFRPADRVDAWRILSVHVNGLSLEPDIAIPVAVGGTEYSLLRIDLRHYDSTGRWKRLWDKLGQFDPFFHVSLTPDRRVQYERTIDVYGDKWVKVDGEWHVEFKKVDGRFIRKYTVPSYQDETVVAVAPWLSDGGRTAQENAAKAKALGTLSEYTESSSPILAGDWFFRYTSIQDEDRNDGRMPGYYDFLGIKNQADYEKIIGLDIKLARTKYKREFAAAIKRSGLPKPVAHNNRRVIGIGTFGGEGFFTLDARDGTGRRNYLRVLDTDTEANNFLEVIAQPDEFDATETFAPMPNDLMVWGLFNNKGERQGNAPDFIASCRNLLGGTNTRVLVNMTCVGCHARGVQPLNDFIRRTASHPLELKVPEYDKYLRAKQLYGADMETRIADAQLRYERAVYKASGGLTAEKFARMYTAFWTKYAETDCTLDDVSLRCGYTRDNIVLRLTDIMRKTNNLDPVIAGLLEKGEESIRPDHLEEGFPLIMTYMRGAVP